MDTYKRRIFCESTTGELEDKINDLEKCYTITDLNITVHDSNNSPSGVLFLASIVYKF
jgi:hypothetical protein